MLGSPLIIVFSNILPTRHFTLEVSDGLEAGGHSLGLLFALCTVFQTQHEAASPGLSPGHQDKWLT